MATAAELRHRVFDYLYGAYPNERPFETFLTADQNSVTTTIQVTDGDDWAENDVLENTVTGEQCFVRSVSVDTLTVTREYGNVAATAMSLGDVVKKSPRWGIDQVDDAITAAIASLEGWGIHVWGTGGITYDATKEAFAVSETDIVEQYGILSLYYQEDNTLIPRPLPFHQHAQLSSTPADWGTSGIVLRVLNWGDLSAAKPNAYYTYAKIPADATELLVRQEELVVLGAIVLLLGMSIAPRTQDPGSHTDRTVQPGQGMRDARFFQGEFFIRARAEAGQLFVERQNLPGDARINRARRWRA